MLQRMLEEKEKNGEVKVIICKGRGYHAAALKARGPIENFRPTLVILLVGVCDITKRDMYTKYTELRRGSTQETVEFVIQQARLALVELKQMNVQNISFATLTGLDLTIYNKISMDHEKIKSHQRELQQQQNIVNHSIIEINRKLVAINTEMNMPTTWTAGHVHRYFRRRYHHYYRRLADGCHPTSEASSYWAKQISKTINQM